MKNTLSKTQNLFANEQQKKTSVNWKIGQEKISKLRYKRKEY